MRRCFLCRSIDDPIIDVGTVAVCPTCAAQLGRELHAHPLRFRTIWPALVEDDDEPEPRVRLDDGTSIELRERTAALKEDLTLAERGELADTFARLGLVRECLLECAWILHHDPRPELAARSLKLLFPRALVADHVRELRTALYPC